MPGVACIPTLRRFLLSKWHPLNIPLQFISIPSSQLSSPAPWLKLGNRASKLTARLESEQEKVPGSQLHLHLFGNSCSQNTSDSNSCRSSGTARDLRGERADPAARQTKAQDHSPSTAIEKNHSAVFVFVFLQQNIKNCIYFIYTNRQVLCSNQPNPTDAITRQENKHSLQVFSPLVAMYYYVGWQEGDLQSTMAQQYAGVEVCIFLHTHQQPNRSANIQQRELKPEGK